MEDVYLDTKDVTISVVVPVFNGEQTISDLFFEIKSVFKSNSLGLQLIFIDDFSSDNSWKIIKELKSTYPNEVLAIRLSRNFGQHNATLCGFKYALGQWVVTIDDDLEYNPHDILKLLAAQKHTGSDLIYGVDSGKNISVLKNIFRNIYKKIARLLEGEEKMTGSSFRLIKGTLANEIAKNARDFSFIDEFIHWHTSNISSINVVCNRKVLRKSRYSLLNLSLLTKELVLFNSLTPLRLITLTGALMSVSNFIWGLVILYRKFVLSISVEGYASIIIAILFSSGIIILSIGVMAEYISKIIKLNYNKPPYREAEIL
ncbi:MAG: glycosyltransferase [Flavobacteriales bacterium]|nr:glycosyltransferase [Flavobacteriales bacterium]